MHYSMAENFCKFCPGPETLWITKIKSTGLNNILEEIAMQLKDQEVVWVIITAFQFIRTECRVKCYIYNFIKKERPA